MSEEQSNFKVTDRRLFNADGTPRDIEREEETAPPAAPESQAASDAPADTERAASTPPPQQDTSSASATAPAAAEPRPDEQPFEDEASGLLDEEGIPGANDPTSFINFLMSIASNAASALGMMEHPVTHQRYVDIELGKHWIDVLGMLQKKTAGNLTPQEKRMLEGLLGDLRMQYVSLVNSPQQAGRFSGTDITGGR